jgi:2-desacetyl-2-hydroxyethyl bacteriochlorophyllide A dehydrogenase
MEASSVEPLGEWPTGTMAAVEIPTPDHLEVVEREIPSVEHGSVLLKIAYIGICGTDLELFNGRSAFVREGLISYPIAFGHEWSGTVVAAAAGTGFSPGDNVVGSPFRTCGVCEACRSGRENVCPNHDEIGVRGRTRGAAAQYLRAPASTVTKLPESVSLLGGALVEPSVTAVQAVLRARVRWDDRVGVIGTGTLGLQALQVARHSGAEVHAVGIEPAGLDAARNLGASWAGTPDEAPDDEYTVVIEASGAPPAMATALRILAPGGRIGLIGIAGHPSQVDTSVAVIKDAEIHAVLHGLYNYPRTVGLMAQGALRGEPLVDAVLPATKPEQAFAKLSTPGRARPKVLMSFDDDRLFTEPNGVAWGISAAVHRR